MTNIPNKNFRTTYRCRTLKHKQPNPKKSWEAPCFTSALFTSWEVNEFEFKINFHVCFIQPFVRDCMTNKRSGKQIKISHPPVKNIKITPVCITSRVQLPS